jgi:hypothetical protein
MELCNIENNLVFSPAGIGAHLVRDDRIDKIVYSLVSAKDNGARGSKELVLSSWRLKIPEL